MRIRFWGVRGSLPSPIQPSVVREKMADALRRATPEDLADGKSRERFLAALPPLLFGTAGGNTPCVSISADGLEGEIVFDCGSGIRELGDAAGVNPSGRYYVFLSHFHWDHLHGLPFFVPAYRSSARIDFHSPVPDFKARLAATMCAPYYPIPLADTSAKKSYHVIDAPVELGPATVSFKKMRHPGDSFSYRVNHGGKRFVYVTDAELDEDDLTDDDGFFTDADVAIVDAQFSPEDAVKKAGWGHSSYAMAVRFAARWGVRHLVLFHHDPASDDAALERALADSRRFLPDSCGNMKISLACEGADIVL